MQFYKPGNLTLGINSFAARIFFNLLVDLIECLIFGEVLKHIKNEAFFNRLLHRVNVERLALTFSVHFSEQLQCSGLWGSCESEHGDIGLFAVAGNLVNNDVFSINSCFRINIHLALAQGHGDSSHILAGSRRMCFVNNNCETLLFKASDIINNVRELLDSGCDNFCISLQRQCKICGCTLIIHHTDQTSLVLHTSDGRL